jgi:hypothetical protein
MRPYVQQPISKDKNVMARTRKYYSKNNYLTFRSKVKVPRRSLRYVTHHLMVMHPHTKYHWQKCYGPDKKILFKKQFFWPRGQRSRSNEGHYGMWHTALWGCTHIPNIIDLSQKKQLFDLEVKGQRSQRYATVPYGHAPTNQISLTYLERQKCYGPDKKILFKKQLFAIQVKGQSPMKVITVCDTPPYGHAPTYQI